jgi:hypothetical protein
MTNPQLTCEHHYVSYHQGDFPPGIYWVRICELCQHIIPEVTGITITTDSATVERLARFLYERSWEPLGGAEWDRNPTTSNQETWRDEARAVLAALTGVPHG